MGANEDLIATTTLRYVNVPFFIGKRWKARISALLLPENICRAMAPSAVAGAFQSILSLL
jgi:hypothetical protein